MSDRCEPPPELRGVDGWHWVHDTGTEVHGVACWESKQQSWLTMPGTEMWYCTPLEAGRYAWRYLSPVATPAEVEALRAERDDLGRTIDNLAEEITALRKDVSDGCEKLTTLRARVAELEGALRDGAKQLLPEEMDEDQLEHADWQYAYEQVVRLIRAALSPTPTGATP